MDVGQEVGIRMPHAVQDIGQVSPGGLVAEAEREARAVLPGQRGHEVVAAAQQRAALRDGVHRALVAAFEGPEGGRFAILAQHDPDDFVFDPSSLGVSRGADHVVIALSVSRTRGTVQKKALYAAIMWNLAEAPGLRPEDVTIIVTENGWEDWSFGRGIAQYVA